MFITRENEKNSLVSKSVKSVLVSRTNLKITGNGSREIALFNTILNFLLDRRMDNKTSILLSQFKSRKLSSTDT